VIFQLFCSTLYIDAVYISSLTEGEWLTSGCGRFKPGKVAPFIDWIERWLGWAGCTRFQHMLGIKQDHSDQKLHFPD
jgi:hypothetical protein